MSKSKYFYPHCTTSGPFITFSTFPPPKVTLSIINNQYVPECQTLRLTPPPESLDLSITMTNLIAGSINKGVNKQTSSMNKLGNIAFEVDKISRQEAILTEEERARCQGGRWRQASDGDKVFIINKKRVVTHNCGKGGVLMGAVAMLSTYLAGAIQRSRRLNA